MGYKAYFLLFKDNIFSNFIFNPSSEFIFHLIKKWNYSNSLIMITLILGSFFVILINYFCGRIISNIIEYIEIKKGKIIFSEHIKVQKKKLEYFSIIFLLLSFIPFWGKFIPFLSGLYRFNLAKVILVCIISKTIYYWILLLT